LISFGILIFINNSHKNRIKLFKNSPFYIIPVFLIFHCILLTGQEKVEKDTSLVKKDTVAVDSLSMKKKDPPFKTKVNYEAEDSIRFSMNSKRIYMYKNSQIKYDDIELKSERVDFDMDKSIVYAKGITDTLGRQVGKPHFKQGDEEFDANDLSYNFKTRKGIIHDIVSKQDEEGFLHAEKTKKQDNGQIHMINGKYTTCNLPHPHFYLALTKAIAIPNEQIVAGPAYIVMEDIPLPIGIPFGFFPSKRNSTSGVLLPTYGEEAQRGFYLRNGGYYFALSDHFDARLTGDIYSKGTWGAAVASNYRKRYKFSGNLNLRYYRNRIGEEGPTQQKSTDFSIVWSHGQEAQANPYRRFSANVNYSSQKFDRTHNYTDPAQFLTNQKQSSISYNQSWPNNSPVNLSVNLRHSQNSRNNSVNLTLPTVAFNVNRIYLFRGKDGSSGNWWDDLSISYTSSLENRITAHEDSLFTPQTLRRMENGFRHSIPFGTSIKIWKKLNINLSPSLNYNGMAYSNYTKRRSVRFYDAENDTFLNKVVIDTISKFTYAQGFAPSLSLSANPTWYGMFRFKEKAKIQAIRHVLRPTVGLGFVPSLKGFAPDYNRTFIDNDGQIRTYSIYERNIYGTPSSSNTKSGSLSIGLFNNLEMKVRSAKDTVTGERKIKIIDNLNFNTSYNIFADSMGWSPVSIGGSTTLFEGMSINISGSMDLYSIKRHVTGNQVILRRDKEFEFSANKRLGRLTSLSFSTGYRFQSKQGTDKKSEGEEQTVRNDYDYFKIPWQFSIDYDFTYSKPYDKSEFMQTFRFSGDFSLTPKWKVNFNSGYDVKANKFSYTTIGVDRDLHCWVMTFNCSPFGETKFYSFQINVRSSILKDIKYDKRKSIYDYQY
jgi:lipopolysaccharide assembly outer membrane protein LptD (OstA)